MSRITRLDESTTRLLGSPTVITTPASLIKELLDNSIDAKATSIEIAISADTVKKIEVRDNGIGIHPNDYDALGRRGHTSKLRNFEELRNHSAKTLGFRGEALAAANSLAQITITTKIASEPIGAILHVTPGVGGISNQKPTSVPVGTTVSVSGLFEKLPVRKREAVKESAKTVDTIRELLRSYAMARPHLRLSFKVLQSTKQSWSYAPKPDANVKEAAIQIFGIELTAHCLEKTFKIGSSATENDSSPIHQDSLQDGQYIFEAFLLKPDSIVPTKVPKQRHFSVDGRPVTGKRGTMKKLSSIYSEHICAFFQRINPGAMLKDCFLRLNVRCPPGSYDANVEPSKDDILFSDEKIVLDGFKDLCREVYKAPTSDNPDTHLPTEADLELEMDNDIGAHEPVTDTIDHLDSLAQARSQAKPRSMITAHPQRDQPLEEPQTINQDASYLPSADFALINSHALTFRNTPPSSIQKPIDKSQNLGYKVDMSTDLNEYSHDHPRMKHLKSTQTLSDPQEEADIIELATLEDVNPWVIAKMNAPKRNIGEQATHNTNYPSATKSPIFEPPMTPDPPILRPTGVAPRDLDVPPSQRSLHSQDGAYQFRPRVPGGPYRSPMPSPYGKLSQEPMGRAAIPASQKRYLQRNNLPWTPPLSREGISPINNRPVGVEHEMGSGGMKQTTISFNGPRGNPNKRRPQEDSNDLDGQDMRYNATQRTPDVGRQNFNYPPPNEQRLLRSHTRLQASRGRPYSPLHVDHAQAEPSTSQIEEPIKTTLPGDDPRAYLLRRQKSMAAAETTGRIKKIRRLKSSLLPLENTPPDGQMHFLLVVKTLTSEALRTSIQQNARYDRFIERGAIKHGLQMSLEMGQAIGERLKSLFREYNDMDGDTEAELEIDFCSLLKGKGILTDI
ncbi:hypothetical protein M426DRAFT_7418 [Hypoxylon sp. CI-4A]|nr:hypothetical protein M426DRAFT_7418 [Hypoxylon sp. CI-4A]